MVMALPSVKVVSNQTGLVVADVGLKLASVKSIPDHGVQLGRRTQLAAGYALDVGAYHGRRGLSFSLVDLFSGQGIEIGMHFAQDVAAAEKQLALRVRELVLVVPRLVEEALRKIAVAQLSLILSRSCWYLLGLASM